MDEILNIGRIYRDADIIRCYRCNYIIPFDLEFYTEHINHTHLCLHCFKQYGGVSHMNNKIESGLDNYADWVEIFTKKTTWQNCGSIQEEYTSYFCNLNPNSVHYKKFATVYYTDMLGHEFDLINETSIEDILNR